MRLQVISPSTVVIDTPDFVSFVIPTEDGQLTVLPHHEPLISAVCPGAIVVSYTRDGSLHTDSYVIGGGVLTITPTECTIIADMVTSEHTLGDLEYIQAQREEAKKYVENYKKENPEMLDPHRLVEIEYELLKYTAMHAMAESKRKN
jgi:F-type H+-transporting ATPase subunit epsilon